MYNCIVISLKDRRLLFIRVRCRQSSVADATCTPDLLIFDFTGEVAIDDTLKTRLKLALLLKGTPGVKDRRLKSRRE